MAAEVIDIFTPYSVNGQLRTEGTCSIAFDNSGDVTFFVNNIWRIVPGQFKSLNDFLPDVKRKTQFTITFAPSDPATTGTNQLAVVITNKYNLLTDKNGNNVSTVRNRC